MCVQSESLRYITNSLHSWLFVSNQPNDCLHQSEKSRLSGGEGVEVWRGWGWVVTGLCREMNCNKRGGEFACSPAPSCANFEMSCLLSSSGALEDFQFHFYGIWFLSAHNLSPFIVHAINSRQVYKLLFKLRSALVEPMTNTIQMELYFFFFFSFDVGWLACLNLSEIQKLLSWKQFKQKLSTLCI